MTDLKEILYNGIADRENLHDVESCLTWMEYYTLLGDYKDCKERLEKCKTSFIEMYDNVVYNIKETDNTDTLQDAVYILQKIKDAENRNGLPGEVIPNEKTLQQQIDRMLNIAADRAEELERKETLRKRRGKILLAAVTAFLLLMTFLGIYYYNNVLPPKTLEMAERQFADGEYEEALSSFSNLSAWKEYKDEAEKGVRKAHLALADEYMDERNYNLASFHYRSAGEYEKEIDAIRLDAGDCMNRRMYEQAVWKYEDLLKAEDDYLSKLQEKEKENGVEDPFTSTKIHALMMKMKETKHDLEKARTLYADELMNSDQPYDAIRQLELLSRTPEISEKLKGMYMDLADYQIGKVREFPEPNAEEAGELGKEIDDIDAQLHYCDELNSLGYDLAEVYPEGVMFDTAGLGLQVYNPEGAETDPEEGRMLVLYRKEYGGHYPENSVHSIILDLFGEQKQESKEYSYYLYPDILYRLPKEKRASSWKDCDTLILASSSYSFYEKVYVITGSNGRVEYEEYEMGDRVTYDTYNCIDKISVFQKDSPYSHITLMEKINKPALESFFVIDETEKPNINELRMGKPDMEWIRSKLGEAVEQFGGEARV